MRQIGQPKRATAPTAPRTGISNLMLMTCLGAADGTILLLAASGGLSSLHHAILVGLTVISGAGAWIAAREAFGDKKRKRDYAIMGALAATSVAATVAAAWLGMALGQAVTLHVLPKAVGIVLFLIAAEIGGLRLPRIKGAPLPVAAIAAAALLEALVQWTP